MVLGGFMIPAGFRYIFAIIDKPVGILNLTPLEADPVAALSNPVFPPLILHTWIGAVSIGFMAAATGLLYASKYDQKLLDGAAKAGLIEGLLVIPQALIGYWFWLVLESESRYLFNNISASILSTGGVQNDVSWSFILMIIVAVYLVIAGVIFYYRRSVILGYSLAPALILGLLAGEFAHDYGRIPYMVIVGDGGIEVELFVNKLMIVGIQDIVAGLVPILVILLTFIVFLYLYLVKGFLSE